MNAEDVRQLSDTELEILADTIQTEQDRRWRKQEKQAVKKAMNLEREGVTPGEDET